MYSTLRQIIAGLATVLAFCGPAAAQFTIPPGSTLDTNGGTIDLTCVALDMQGTLNINSGTIASDSSATFAAGANVTGTGGTISVGGDLIVDGALLNAGDNSIVLRDGCDPGNTSQISGNIVVRNLTLTSTTGRTFVLPAGANITVLGTLTILGTAGQPVQLVSASGTAVINLGPAATVVSSFATVPPTVHIGPAAPATTQAIPTLSEYGVLLLSLLMAGAYWLRTRPRPLWLRR